MIKRVVYSLWTKPMNDTYVGFNSEEALMECFALSVHFSKKWFEEVHLITDIKGKKLVDSYGIEFDYLSTELEEGLYGVDKSNWALGKIYACKIQEKPFIHIDNDVILFKPLPKSFLEKEAGFQNPETHIYHTFYGDMIRFDEQNYKTPAKWYKFPTNEEGKSFNCGVIAFNKLNILQEWWQEAIKYVNYLKEIGGYGESAWNLPSVIFEQHFICSICYEYNIKVGFLTDYHSEEKSHWDFIDDELAGKLGYAHLIAQSKRNPEIEQKVKNAVKWEGIKIKYPNKLHVN